MATQPSTQGLYGHTTTTTPGNSSQYEVEADKIQANLFFDGTLNNYFNVTTKDNALRAKHGGIDTSYESALSNVARMWESIDREPDGPDIGAYIEGMGTTQLAADSILGYSIGAGKTGIESRAQSAFQPLQAEVIKKRGDLGPPAVLELNLFGFSRGAATARHYASLLRNKNELAKHFTDDWSKVRVIVNFVGLFDTVSAEGIPWNDVDDLQLRFTDESAQRVFQLKALDEYRANFSLTTIDSACQAKALVNGARVPMGFELGIPGSHSDVGGGYRSGTDKSEDPEIRFLPKNTATGSEGGTGVMGPGPQAFVYGQGWYTPAETTDVNGYTHKRQVRGDYYKVGLSLMVDMAERYTTTVYPARFKSLTQAQTPEIAQVQTKLRAFAKEKAFAPGQQQQANWALDEQLGTDQAKAFRNEFLHLSVNLNKFGMEPRYKNQTDMERRHVKG